MAKCCQPSIRNALWPGVIISCFLNFIFFLVVYSLWRHMPLISWREFMEDSYLWHVIGFTFWQALLSTLLSVIPSIFLAKSLFRRHFPGRILFLRLHTMIFVLPVFVVIMGVFTVYGRTGWIAQLCQWLGIVYQFNLYGIKGILLVHVFFNMPLAIRMLLQALDSISIEQRQLALQLGMNPWYFFRFVEWPYLRRQILPTSSLIFMLCFASFATVLTLGGGPASTTIELAIYQSLSYDFDLNKAAFLSLVQIFCCLSLVLFNQKFNVSFSSGYSSRFLWKNEDDSRWSRWWDFFLISCAIWFFILPLLAIIIEGMNAKLLLRLLQQSGLWSSFFNSIYIAINAGVLCMIFTIMLLWTKRELRLRRLKFFNHIFELSELLILAVPSIVLAVGFFLLLKNTVNLTSSSYSLIIVTNALMAVPYAVKILENPMYDLAERYNALCISLQIKGINRLYLIEFKALKRLMAQTFSFSCLLSIGDFGIIALFGNDNFCTLPCYLYQQLGSYRQSDAVVTALLLLSLCLGLFSLLEYLSGKEYD
ncbi:thiamine/thiamine pyrophosphate ABC transporter permease ThiP [Candidatus Liberibacter asiaticus]|uniref:Thiamine transport system permease protein ThiP n=2 Tax=Liberibacter asiaticus TaxID=34021 RepID=C6XF81_LIBAP|nr:thiamine/thiamine pyrophosphate ABC transporter permease ThiP [Candidatus Liberibacter asiaticus]ACT57033.2 thiamine transporter membrane protein [Candidatus Liberibacter asiaticus str. psy62]AGH17001.1 thiamine transporter membrane protein [Candidatus Liberibacter asiaticus str. gxpsy]ALK07335.1 thiamine/thiamine pyrophosphate ABC transporter permease ThiP [Candidatus Liberibacter asiaticus]ASK52826.1 thiamine/thiamine pyrophosphate ABC transporter permease ThiP [Candidatus Liberibacter asi